MREEPSPKSFQSANLSSEENKEKVLPPSILGNETTASSFPSPAVSTSFTGVNHPL